MTIACLIQDGKVFESGSHDELMELGGLYYSLVQAQKKQEKEGQFSDE